DLFALAIIKKNYIAGNNSYNGGGGIFAESTGAVTIVGNVIANNTSGYGGDGGGLYDANNGPLLFLNNTLYGNASHSGGTSEIATGTVTLNSTFKNNIVYATSGNAISCPAYNGPPGATNNIVYSVNPATNGDCAAFDTSDNMFVEPGMVDPANGDFHLHDGSPAIDAGISDPDLPSTDIGGTQRVLDGTNDGTAVVDIGAYEFVSSGVPAGWATLAPLGATFPTTAVGSSSAPIDFTSSNNGSALLSIRSITVNNAFAQSNNCPPVLAVHASCLIEVTFTPTANNFFSGAL